MTRSAARRSGAVQADKSLPPAPPVSDHHPDDPLSAPESSGVPWYWRFVLFLWGTSFALLFLYEWLVGILKSW
jgi:hypothetical protein